MSAIFGQGAYYSLLWANLIVVSGRTRLNDQLETLFATISTF